MAFNLIESLFEKLIFQPFPVGLEKKDRKLDDILDSGLQLVVRSIES